MCPEILRSSHTATMPNTATNPVRMRIPTTAAARASTQPGTPSGATFSSSVRKMFPPSMELAVRLPDHDVRRADDRDRVRDERARQELLEHRHVRERRPAD